MVLTAPCTTSSSGISVPRNRSETQTALLDGQRSSAAVAALCQTCQQSGCTCVLTILAPQCFLTIRILWAHHCMSSRRRGGRQLPLRAHPGPAQQMLASRPRRRRPRHLHLWMRQRRILQRRPPMPQSRPRWPQSRPRHLPFWTRQRRILQRHPPMPQSRPRRTLRFCRRLRSPPLCRPKVRLKSHHPCRRPRSHFLSFQLRQRRTPCRQHRLVRPWARHSSGCAQLRLSPPHSGTQYHLPQSGERAFHRSRGFA